MITMDTYNTTTHYHKNPSTPKVQGQLTPLACLLAVILLPMVVLFLVPIEIGDALTVEDGIVENFTALAFFFGAIASLAALKNNRYKTLPLLWFFLCIVFLGEETSWFQRQLDYNVASVESMNAQSEFNFHNLDIFHGADSDHGNPFDLNSQNMFRYGFLFYFVAFPFFLRVIVAQVLKQNNIFSTIASKLNYVPPSLQFVFTILVVLACSFTLSILANVFNLGNDRTIAEYRECIYALVILFYTYFYLYKNKKHQYSS